jgi:hypothetical protein
MKKPLLPVAALGLDEVEEEEVLLEWLELWLTINLLLIMDSVPVPLLLLIRGIRPISTALSPLNRSHNNDHLPESFSSQEVEAMAIFSHGDINQLNNYRSTVSDQHQNIEEKLRSF